jgi:uncharacterized protein YeaO (DUF488 family)
MPIRVVQLGSPRGKGEGIRIGTVRRPPRGVRKDDYGRLDFYDVWLPQLAPSAELAKLAQHGLTKPTAWKRFEQRYSHELSAPDNCRLLDLLAALSKAADFAIGCYCADETTCHRSILKRILQEHGASIQ